MNLNLFLATADDREKALSAGYSLSEYVRTRRETAVRILTLSRALLSVPEAHVYLQFSQERDRSEPLDSPSNQLLLRSLIDKWCM